MLIILSRESDSGVQAMIQEEMFLPDQIDVPHGDAVPERRLTAAIIMQAVYDLREPLSDEHWFRAAAWVTGLDGSSSFTDYCGILSIDPEAIIERLVQENVIPENKQEIVSRNGRKSNRRHARRKRI